MSLYGLTAVRKSANGLFIESAVVQQADGATDRWMGDAYEYDVADIADMIHAGHEVWTIFVTSSGNVCGPRVFAQISSGGKKEIFIERVPGKTFDDLVQLGAAGRE